MTAASPRLRVESECVRLGHSEVIRRCLELLAGGSAEVEFVVALGGPGALRILSNDVPDSQTYWLRVWAARGLLWAGPGTDAELLRCAFSDDSWRVREMICKVVGRHRVGDMLADVAELESDPTPRVRAAASRAVMRILETSA